MMSSKSSCPNGKKSIKSCKKKIDLKSLRKYYLNNYSVTLHPYRKKDDANKDYRHQKTAADPYRHP